MNPIENSTPTTLLTAPARQQPPRQSLLSKFRAWRRCDHGVSAVEFALLAPLLFFGLLATVDLGFALYERMTIDHVLRAGAQSAMVDRDVETIRKVLQATAAKNFTLAGQTAAAGTDVLSLSVERYCSCPQNKTVVVACSTTCTGPTSTDIYYRLSATKSYDGLFLPITIGRFSLGALTLSSSAQVQVR